MENKNTQYVNKCRKNNYDMIQFSVPKGQRAIIKAYADKHNESLNEYLRRILFEHIQKDELQELTFITVTNDGVNKINKE